MSNPTTGYSPSRPFKIFISLQDKWEIGAPLTEIHVLDAFRALRKYVATDEPTTEDVSNHSCKKRACANYGAVQMVMVANAFYEALEPLALWKQVFTAIVADVTSQSGSVEVSADYGWSFPPTHIFLRVSNLRGLSWLRSATTKKQLLFICLCYSLASWNL